MVTPKWQFKNYLGYNLIKPNSVGVVGTPPTPSAYARDDGRKNRYRSHEEHTRR